MAKLYPLYIKSYQCAFKTRGKVVFTIHKVQCAFKTHGKVVSTIHKVLPVRLQDTWQSCNHVPSLTRTSVCTTLQTTSVYVSPTSTLHWFDLHEGIRTIKNIIHILLFSIARKFCIAEKSGFWISRTKLIWDITESRFTDWLTEISIYRQTDRHTDRQTDRTSKDFFGSNIQVKWLSPKTDFTIHVQREEKYM